MIKVGDQITVKFAPLKDGGDGGFVTAQGQQIAFKIPTEADLPAPQGGKSKAK